MDKNDFFNDLDLSPKGKRTQKIVNIVVWIPAILQSITVFFGSSTPFGVVLLCYEVIGAVGINLLSLWASKDGRLKKFRIQSLKRWGVKKTKKGH
ncbi:MAG: hypothetical protein AB1413_04715 [Thermodesulfobacteriota bacterium]